MSKWAATAVLVLLAGAGGTGAWDFEGHLRDTDKSSELYVDNVLELAQSTGGYTGYRGQDEMWPKPAAPNPGPGYTLVCDAAGNCRPVVFGPNGQNGPVHPQAPYPVYPPVGNDD